MHTYTQEQAANSQTVRNNWCAHQMLQALNQKQTLSTRKQRRKWMRKIPRQVMVRAYERVAA